MMKTAKGKLSSHYYKVRVLDTGEEQVFDSPPECIDWSEKVKHIFQNPMMKFEIIEVKEWHLII